MLLRKIFTKNRKRVIMFKLCTVIFKICENCSSSILFCLIIFTGKKSFNECIGHVITKKPAFWIYHLLEATKKLKVVFHTLSIYAWQRFIVNADARNALRRGRKFTVVKTDEYFNKYLYVQLFKLKMCCQEDLVYVNHCKQLELAKFGQ